MNQSTISGPMRLPLYRGFTLIELMIVLAIIGIISAIAYPAYTQYLLKSGRSEGTAGLLQLMERQENYYRDNLSYATDLTTLGYAASTTSSETGRYTLSAGTCAAGTIRRCVLLTATPIGKQANDPAGAITLNSRGTRSANWAD